jgi:hypothetical protein
MRLAAAHRPPTTTSSSLNPSGVWWSRAAAKASVRTVSRCGGRTPGGRFCTVFTFNDADLIESMHVYLDPDVTGADHERFVTQDR